MGGIMLKFWSDRKKPEGESENLSGKVNEDGEKTPSPKDSDLPSEALAKVLRILGRHSFDVDQVETETIEKEFEQWAMHVLVGSPVSDAPEESGENTAPRRDWATLNQFVNSHRQKEESYVTQSLHDLREVLWMFTHTIGRAITEDQETDRQMAHHLQILEGAASAPSATEMRQALLTTVEGIHNLVKDRNQRQQARVRQLGTKLQEVEAELGNARKQMALDPLTQLYNRAALDTQLERLAGLSVLSGSSATLFMVDIDHFKQINDTYGHRAGDTVLRQLADRIVGAFPSRTDFVARYGGEELAVVIKGGGDDLIHRLGERLLSVVRAQPFEHEGTSIPLTVSVGASELISGEEPSSWVERADRALYQAKATGRNRLCEGTMPSGSSGSV